MGALFQIVTTADPVPADRRLRLWLDVGQPMAVAGFLTMPVFVDGEICLELFDDQGRHLHQFPLAPMGLEPAAPYRTIPRAIRIHRFGGPAAVLMETQYTGDHKPGWVNNNDEDERNEYIQQIPDAG